MCESVVITAGYNSVVRGVGRGLPQQAAALRRGGGRRRVVAGVEPVAGAPPRAARERRRPPPAAVPRHGPRGLPEPVQAPAHGAPRARRALLLLPAHVLPARRVRGVGRRGRLRLLHGHRGPRGPARG